MGHDQIIQILNDYKSGLKSGGSAWKILGVVVVLIQALIIFAIDGDADERATVAAAFIAIDAIGFAAYQWWEQRRQTTLEAYFTRLDIPNQRRLSFYEQLAAQSSRLGQEELKKILEQFYVFYVYAELDNLEYAMNKYATQSITEDLAERAAKTFISRCEQSTNFRENVCQVVRQSGYPGIFEALVLQLSCCPLPADGARKPHPMQFNELEIIDKIQPNP